MKLRPPSPSDAPRILAWMENPDISKHFRFQEAPTNLQAVLHFIKTANTDTSCHYAITDDADLYMGTISLKHIDYENKNAEYAIALHMDAIGKEYARQATDRVLTIAFHELGLHRIYLNVLTTNTRAIRFYEKYGFIFEGETRDSLMICGEFKSLKWYRILASEYDKNHKPQFE